MLCPSASPREVESNCNLLERAMGNPGVIDQVATAKGVAAVTRALKVSCSDNANGDCIKAGVAILHILAKSEPGAAALEEAAAADCQCWVHALVRAMHASQAVQKFGAEVFGLLASRSSACAARIAEGGAVPVLVHHLGSHNAQPPLPETLRALRALAGSSSVVADMIVRADSSVTDRIIEMLKLAHFHWDVYEALLSLVSPLAALTQGFAEDFIARGGVEAVCSAGNTLSSYLCVKTACVHALEALALRALDKIVVAELERIAVAVLDWAAGSKDPGLKDACFRTLLCLSDSECAMAYIVKTNKVMNIDIGTTTPPQNAFLKRYAKAVDKIVPESESEPEPEAKASSVGPAKGGVKDETNVSLKSSSNSNSSSGGNSSKKSITNEKGSHDNNGNDDDCVVVGGSGSSGDRSSSLSLPPCKKQALAEGGVAGVAGVTAAAAAASRQAARLFLLWEHSYVTAQQQHQHTTIAKALWRFKEAFKFESVLERLGLPAQMGVVCSRVAERVLKEKYYKGRLTPDQAKAIALYTVEGIPGVQEAPALTLAKVLGSRDAALAEKWFPYVALLQGSLKKLKPFPNDLYCAVPGKAEQYVKGRDVLIPSFFCSTTDIRTVVSAFGADEKGVVFCMKQTFGYDVHKFAAQQEGVDNLWVSSPECKFCVEEVTARGNLTFVEMRFTSNIDMEFNDN